MKNTIIYATKLSLILLSFILLGCNKKESAFIIEEDNLPKTKYDNIVSEVFSKGTHACKIDNKAGQSCENNNSGDCKKLAACKPLSVSLNPTLVELQDAAYAHAQDWVNQEIIEVSYLNTYSQKVYQELVEYYIYGNESNYN